MKKWFKFIGRAIEYLFIDAMYVFFYVLLSTVLPFLCNWEYLAIAAGIAYVAAIIVTLLTDHKHHVKMMEWPCIFVSAAIVLSFIHKIAM